MFRLQVWRDGQWSEDLGTVETFNTRMDAYMALAQMTQVEGYQDARWRVIDWTGSGSEFCTDLPQAAAWGCDIQDGEGWGARIMDSSPPTPTIQDAIWWAQERIGELSQSEQATAVPVIWTMFV